MWDRLFYISHCPVGAQERSNGSAIKTSYFSRDPRKNKLSNLSIMIKTDTPRGEVLRTPGISHVQVRSQGFGIPHPWA